MSQQSLQLLTDEARDDLAKTLVEGLNPPQQEAVLANEGPVLILAGAGSGKTRTITHKMAYLVGVLGLAPWEILAVTFTNKAAAEMKERTKALMGDKRGKHLDWLGTFHSIGMRLLRRHADQLGMERSFTIYDSDDQKKMIKQCLDEMNVSAERFKPGDCADYINKAKQQCHGPGHRDLPRQGYNDQRYADIYAHYDQKMVKAGAMDFADLIFRPVQLFRNVPLIASEYKERWKYIIVDEFQDTNVAQFQLLKAALNDAKNICVVGDDDQSIYRWRGATVENILGFPKHFPGTTVVRLEQNYRSSGSILAVASKLISTNKQRHEKTLWTDRDDGPKAVLYGAETEREEAEWTARRITVLQDRYSRKEIAVFYRTNSQSRALEEALLRKGIPHRIFGGQRFYDRAEIKDILGYLRVVHNASDEVNLRRVLNTPARGIGKGTIEKVQSFAVDHDVSFWEALRSMAMGGPKALQKKLSPFVALVESLREEVEVDTTAVALTQRIIEATHYRDHLFKAYPQNAESREENLGELLSAMTEHAQVTGDPSVGGFLDRAALISDLDNQGDGADQVTLMTVHMAKGLEFDAVLVTGLEEGLMPHVNSSDSRAGVEEERRLAYVAFTRPRHELFLSWARSRMRFGRTKGAQASRFLDELPVDRIEEHGYPHLNRRPLNRPGVGRRGSGSALGNFDQTRVVRRRHNWKGVDEVAADPTPDYEDFSQEQPMGIGSAIFHPKFGHGVIKSFSGIGPKANVEVLFDSGVKKKIRAQFLSPA